jgi:hypothetical protein
MPKIVEYKGNTYMAIPEKSNCMGCAAADIFELCHRIRDCGEFIYIKVPNIKKKRRTRAA